MDPKTLTVFPSYGGFKTRALLSTQNPGTLKYPNTIPAEGPNAVHRFRASLPGPLMDTPNHLEEGLSMEAPGPGVLV